MATREIQRKSLQRPDHPKKGAEMRASRCPKRRYLVATVGAVFATVAAVAFAGGAFNAVRPTVFDPARTAVVSAGWVDGIGCPSTLNSQLFTESACPSVDPSDPRNEGLLLADSVEVSCGLGLV